VTNTVVLAGPANPTAFREWLNLEDGRRAAELPGLGGSALTNLAKAFLTAGQHVELVTLAPEVRGEVVTLEGPKLRILIGPFRPRARHRCPDAFREERRHVRGLLSGTSGRVVNAHWTYEFALGAMRLPNRATVVTAHDAPFTILRHDRPRSYRAVRAAMAVALRLQSPIMTAVSPDLAAAWRRQMLYRGAISVIPNVVPPVATSRPTHAEGLTPKILEVANAQRLKNVSALLRAMPKILSSYPSATLQLVGPGLTPQSSLGRLARRLRVCDNVEFFGCVKATDLDSLYRRATLFVHASLTEACSMSVGEAMSYGLPVVAGSRSGGVSWMLDGGRAGLLVDVRKPAAIAEGVIRLLGDPPLYNQLAVAARARALSCLSPEAVSDAYLEVYAQAQATVT
jgi:glycosyltransferase involved in cell wall biosynthesis